MASFFMLASKLADLKDRRDKVAIQQTQIGVYGDIQDLSLSEQSCEECGASFFYMEALDGDCSHQRPNYCPKCGRKNVTANGQ